MKIVSVNRYSEESNKWDFQIDVHVDGSDKPIGRINFDYVGDRIKARKKIQKQFDAIKAKHEIEATAIEDIQRLTDEITRS